MGYFVQTDVTRQIDRDANGDVLVSADGLSQSSYGTPDVQLEEAAGQEGADDAGDQESGEGVEGEDEEQASGPPQEAGGAASAGATMPNEAKRAGDAGAATAGAGQQAPGADEGAAGDGAGAGPTVQTSPAGGGASGNRVSLSSYLDDSSGQGSGLDGTTNARMSQAFGRNFSDVRVHDDAAAHNVCASLGANAFATGSHVYFASGKNSPGSQAGDRLLAHELTHVVQQTGGKVNRSVAMKGVSLSTPGDAYEQEADLVGDAVAAVLHSGSPSQEAKQENKRDKEGLEGAANEPSGNRQVAGNRDDVPAVPTVSLAEAIVQRKLEGIPDVQMDVGVVLGIVGVAVSAGAWIATTDNSRQLLVSPNMEWLAPRTPERDAYRQAHPWQQQSWYLMSIFQDAPFPRPNETWGLTFKWKHNGAELYDLELSQHWRGHWASSSKAQFKVFDDQSVGGRLGFRAELDLDPGFRGHWKSEFTGWIGVDGAAQRGSIDWRAA